MNQLQNNQLGVVPFAIAGSTALANGVASLATAILPGVFKDRYAGTNAMLDQVSQITPSLTQTSAQLETVAGQIDGAYKQAIASMKDKATTLQQVEGSNSDASKIRTLAIVGVVTALSAVAIHKLV